MLLVFILGVLISVPILLAAMVITSQLGGGVDFGNIGMVILKSLPVLVLAHAIYLIPSYFLSIVLSLMIMMIGFMIVFRLDVWEARMLVFINWALNYALRLSLIAMLS